MLVPIFKVMVRSQGFFLTDVTIALGFVFIRFFFSPIKPVHYLNCLHHFIMLP